ncbi:MAG TPA: hypothetical protein VL947_03440 [Cytophagales bacterium]|nr:hypothetical protein [Cytophagales bacterium]
MTLTATKIGKEVPMPVVVWVVASIIYVVLLYLRYGYQIGIEDGPEFLTFAKIAHDPSLYKNDLFMQSMLDMGWNERTLFGKFYAIFPNLEWAGWITHALLALAMILGIQVCAYNLLQDFWWAQLAVLTQLILFNNIEIGGNMLYFNDIQGESFANTLGVWAFAAWLYKRKPLSIVLLTVATWFHPLIGFQLFLIFTGSYLLYSFYHKTFADIKNMMLAVLAYFICAGWLILFIFIGHKSGPNMVSTHEFMDLTYKFALMCHFTPHVFSRKGYILLSICVLAGLYYFSKRHKELAAILIVLLLGYAIYAIGYYSDSYLITSSWWFRTNMWTKFLGLLALCALLQEQVKGIGYKIIPILVLLLSFVLPILFVTDNKYLFPWKDLRKDNDEIDIAIAVKNMTHKDAVFIQPFFFSALKYFGERASYVEYHRILRSRATIKIWYDRLGEVYALDKRIDVARNPLLIETMDTNYSRLTSEDLDKLKQKGVQYMITFKSTAYPGRPVLYENNTYKLIEL